jgi:hypothetical protein
LILKGRGHVFVLKWTYSPSLGIIGSLFRLMRLCTQTHPNAPDRIRTCFQEETTRRLIPPNLHHEYWGLCKVRLIINLNTFIL